MRAHATAQRDEARRLVAQEGLTYAQAAAATGVPESTLRKWGAADNWTAERGRTQGYLAQADAVKQRLMEDAISEEGKADPQKIFAWLQVEKAFPTYRYGQGGVDVKAKRALLAGFLDGLVAYFAEHDRDALALIEPHIGGLAKVLGADV